MLVAPPSVTEKGKPERVNTVPDTVQLAIHERQPFKVGVVQT